MKLHKALRRHGSQVQRKLEIQGVGKIPDCFKVASLTGRMTRRNVQLADGWYSETTCYLLLQVYLSKLWDSWLIIPTDLHVCMPVVCFMPLKVMFSSHYLWNMLVPSFYHTILLLSSQISPWLFACIQMLSHTHTHTHYCFLLCRNRRWNSKYKLCYVR